MHKDNVSHVNKETVVRLVKLHMAAAYIKVLLAMNHIWPETWPKSKQLGCLKAYTFGFTGKWEIVAINMHLFF